MTLRSGVDRGYDRGMDAECLDVEVMAGVLGEWLASGLDVTTEDRERAIEALAALGIPDLLVDLDLARRILRFGNSFHTIARFFADGSAEQAFLLRLAGDTDPGPAS